MKRYLVRILLGVLLTGWVVMHATGFVRIPFLAEVEHFAYDARLRFDAPLGIDQRIVIVAIDELSLREQGHWPWSREKLAALVRNLLSRYGAAVVGFDVVFAERDESHDIDTLRRLAAQQGDGRFVRRLEDLSRHIDRDRLFAEALALGPTVLGYYFDTNPDKQFVTGELPPAAFDIHPSMEASIFLPKASGYGSNLPVLMQSAYAGGFISNPLIDQDGIVRRAPLLHEYRLGVYESLSLAMTAAYLGDIVVPVFTDEQRLVEGYPALEAIELGGETIRIDAQGAVLVSYRGPAGSYPYISATSVIEGSVQDPALLDGAIVLVGATAPGLLDLRSTPFGPVYPGVEVHANVIASLLDRSIRWQPAYTLAAELVTVAGFGLVAAAVIPLLSAVMASLVALILIAGAISFNLYLWEVQNHVLPIAGTVLLCFGVYVLNMFYGYFVESRVRAQMNSLFGQYVPPKLVAQMSQDPRHYSLTGEKKEITVLFSDVRGFTSISERLDPVELSQLMNSFLTPMTRIIHDNLGTIDKYMGDAIMAFWGAPVEDPHHADNAVAAALAMQIEIRALSRVFQDKQWPALRIGIGINTGMMSVGNMGSSFRRAYTVMGDAVNLGSRLEGLTKLYGVDIVVSDRVKELAPRYLYRELDIVRVHGRDKPVTLFQPVASASEATDRQRTLANLSDEFLSRYRNRQWDAAETTLAELQRLDGNDTLGDHFLSLIRSFRDAPPAEDWNGVLTLETK